jgi:hypothetical protein
MTIRHLGWEHMCTRCGCHEITEDQEKPKGWLLLATVNCLLERVRDCRDLTVAKTLCRACVAEFHAWCAK